MVFVRNENRDKRRVRQRVVHFVSAGKQPVLHRALGPGAGQVGRNGALGRRGDIGFCGRTARGRARVHPPVVQHLGHMHGCAPLAQLQKQIVVLRAVAGAVQPAHGVKQPGLKHGEMADIIAAVEVIGRKIRLKMACAGPLDAGFKQSLVGIQKRCARLAGGFQHLVHRVRGDVYKRQTLNRRSPQYSPSVSSSLPVERLMAFGFSTSAISFGVET